MNQTWTTKGLTSEVGNVSYPLSLRDVGRYCLAATNSAHYTSVQVADRFEMRESVEDMINAMRLTEVAWSYG